MPTAFTRVAQLAYDGTARALTSRAAKGIYVGLLVLLVLFLWANMVRRALQGHGSQFEDFVNFSRDLVYERVNVYLEYATDYTITKYPPFFSLLFAPLVPLHTAIAASFWFLLNLCLAVAATYLSVLTVDEGLGERRVSLFVIPFVLTAGIIGSNLETAQVNILIVFFLCLSLFTFKIGRDILAGLLLGLITALKLTPGLFVLYFAYKRAYRVVLGAGLGLIICWLIIPPLVFGFDNFVAIMRGWYHVVTPFIVEGTLAEGIGGFRHTNQSLSAVFHRFFTATPADAHRIDFYLNVLSLGYVAANWIVKAIAVTIVGCLVWLSRTPLENRRGTGLAFEYALVMIATLFISPISWINHYVFLLFPYAAAVYYIRTRPTSNRERRILLYGVIASFILVSSSASILMQALSLPFFGALVLAIALSLALHAQSQREGERVHASATVSQTEAQGPLGRSEPD